MANVVQLPGPGDYATEAPTSHPHDPRNSDPSTDILDRAHNRAMAVLAEGDSFHKVNAGDIFADLIKKDHAKAVELLERLFQLHGMTGDVFKDDADRLVTDAHQVVSDFVEVHLIDAALEDIEQEEREEAMEQGEPYYGEEA